MGQLGFEESCKSIKIGVTFCKEIAAILQERSNLESHYHKNLSKLAIKMSRTVQTHQEQSKLTHCKTLSKNASIDDKKSKQSKDKYGQIRKSFRLKKDKRQTINVEKNSIFFAWEVICQEMDEESQIHKNISVTLNEDIVKPLINLSKIHSDLRKTIESDVEKTCKLYEEARSDEIKNKVASFENHKQVEKLKENIEALTKKNSEAFKSVPNAASSPAEKEIFKLEEKMTRILDNCKKFDHSYHDSCISSENFRQDKEFALSTSKHKLKHMESDRLTFSVDILSKYLALMTSLPDKMHKILDNISQSIIQVNKQAAITNNGQSYLNVDSPNDGCSLSSSSSMSSSINSLRSDCSNATSFVQQNLFDFYAEDLSNPMNKERRKQLLDRHLVILRHDLEKHKAAKESVDALVKMYSHQINDARSPDPNIAQSSAKEIRRKFLSCHHTYNHLQASYNKVNKVLAQLNNQICLEDPRGKYIETFKDSKNGITNSTLKIPSWDEEVGLAEFEKCLKPILESLNRNQHNPSHLPHNTSPNSFQPEEEDYQSKTDKNGSQVMQNAKNGHQNREKDEKTNLKGCGLTFSGIGKNLFGKAQNKSPKTDAATHSPKSNKSTPPPPSQPAKLTYISSSPAHTDQQSPPSLYPSVHTDNCRYNDYENKRNVPSPPLRNHYRGNILGNFDRDVPVRNNRPFSYIDPPPYNHDHSSAKERINHDDFVRPLNNAGNKVCIVKYEYTANKSDELSIKPGDILEIYNKQHDGWWKGQRIVPWGNHTGIFPSTYVQELMSHNESKAYKNQNFNSNSHDHNLVDYKLSNNNRMSTSYKYDLVPTAPNH
ncbi:unnamed protein product [Gordionus sp. m RMFG-2023]|uniref:nostrin-like isoform X2 n=1 Tax=Gordionus sp. m RMFG-2023 TaxID=3053472 RepID=UPI0030E44BE9